MKNYFKDTLLYIKRYPYPFVIILLILVFTLWDYAKTIKHNTEIRRENRTIKKEIKQIEKENVALEDSLYILNLQKKLLIDNYKKKINSLPNDIKDENNRIRSLSDDSLLRELSDIR